MLDVKQDLCIKRYYLRVLIILLLLAFLALLLIQPPRAYGAPSKTTITVPKVQVGSLHIAPNVVPLTGVLPLQGTISSLVLNNLKPVQAVKKLSSSKVTPKPVKPAPVAATAPTPAPIPPPFDPNNSATWPTCPAGDIVRADNGQCAVPANSVSTDTTPSAAVTTTTSSYSGDLAAWLLALRTCESGGNYAEDTGNGFYGAYQFTIDTWNHWNTGYARADLAPASVQDATIIENTLATSGLSTQNPGCFAKMGLSNYPPSS